MSKHENCGCHTESTHKCNGECNCNGVEKTAGDNKWVSPPSAKACNANTTKCENKEKTPYNNQWT